MLTKPNATFVSILSMQWFTAVKANMPYSADGLNSYPAAGPYYIASRDPGRSTVLKRNPYYKGDRPANPDQIVFTPNVNVDQSLLQVKAGQADIDLIGVPPTATADLGKQYGVNKGRFFVGATSCVNYMGMNTARAPFDNVNLRKAVNWAIDRPAQVRLLGAYAGKRTDQILVPGIPGYHAYNVYAIKGADISEGQAGRWLRDRLCPDAQRRAHHELVLDEPCSGCGVQPQADRVQDQRRPDAGDHLLPGDPDQGDELQLRHQRRLVRRLLRPVRLLQRAVRRPQDPGLEQQRLHVLQQCVVSTRSWITPRRSPVQLAPRRTRSSTRS